MAAKKKKRSAPKRRRKRPTSMSASPRRRRTFPRRRKRALSSGGGGGSSKVTFMKALAGAGAGAVGGAIYVAPKFMFKFPTWGKALYAVGASVAAHKFKAPNVGSGIAGAFVMDMATTMFGVTLKDDLEDAEYVDPDLLSDTGFEDDDGNAITIDENGNVYALDDDGEYVQIGTADDLPEMNDDYALSNNLPDSAMIPLQDAYALSNPSQYALSGGGY